MRFGFQAEAVGLLLFHLVFVQKQSLLSHKSMPLPPLHAIINPMGHIDTCVRMIATPQFYDTKPFRIPKTEQLIPKQDDPQIPNAPIQCSHSHPSQTSLSQKEDAPPESQRPWKPGLGIPQLGSMPSTRPPNITNITNI